MRYCSVKSCKSIPVARMFYFFIPNRHRTSNATLAKRKRTKASIMVFSSISKRSKHLRQNKYYFRSEANTFDSKTTVFKAKANMSDSQKIIFEAKRTYQIERKLFSKRSKHIRQKENYFQSVANTLDRKNIIFEAKRTHQLERKLFLKQSEHIRQ